MGKLRLELETDKVCFQIREYSKPADWCDGGEGRFVLALKEGGGGDSAYPTFEMARADAYAGIIIECLRDFPVGMHVHSGHFAPMMELLLEKTDRE